MTTHDYLRLMPGQPLTLPVRLWNPGAVPLHNLHIELSSDYPTVQILRGSTEVPELKPGAMLDRNRGDREAGRRGHRLQRGAGTRP